MTIALALLTREGILLAADNGDYYEKENRFEETAQKIFAWPRQGIAFMHAGVAGRKGLEISEQLEAFMQSTPYVDVEPVRNTVSRLFCFLYEQWRNLLKADDPSDKIELLIAGYDEGAPVCAILDIYHRSYACGYHVPKYVPAHEFELFSLGGRKRLVDEILGLPNNWPNGLLYPSDMASALMVAKFIILKIADREPGLISRKMQIAKIVGGKFAWIEPPPGMVPAGHIHSLTSLGSSSP
ncbi:MAG: hypothetical protein FJ026_15400 [Chloroflexi bacterium]|nr:hypothetical protein [Chloroflexota bacterium]